MKEQDSKTEEEEKFLSYLNSKHLRKTPERFEIFKCTMQQTGHFDVDLLYQSLEKAGYHVSKATIYNTIELMCESGIIKKLLFDPHQAKYELANCNHIHLICMYCNKVEEKNLTDFDDIISRLGQSDFYPRYITASIYGVCSNCRKKDSVFL